MMKFKFQEIRSAHIEIKDSLEKLSGEKSIGLNTKIAEDLGLWGDDNYEFLSKFIDHNELNFDKFEYHIYFQSEGELFDGFNVVSGLLNLPFLIVTRIVKWIFPQVKTPFDSHFLPLKNERTDLTFGDLIVSKLRGKFSLRKDTRIEM